MLSNKSYLLFDTTNLAYVAFHRAARLDNLDKENIPNFYNGHVRAFNERIQTIKQYHGLAEVLFALDHKPLEKYKIFPDYKQGRFGRLRCKDGSYFSARAGCLDDLKRQNATVVYVKDHEADDAIASFVAQNFYNDMTVVSTDKDLWSILDHPNVRILNPVLNEYIGKQHLREAFCTKDKHKVITQYLTKYAQIKIWKAMWGDASDKVPNVVPRMKKQLLPPLIKSDGSWEDFEARINNTEISDNCKLLLEKNKEKIKINRKLVELKYNCELVIENYQKIEESTVREEVPSLTAEELESLF